MNFFGHDSNASNDPRIKKLLIKYGYSGTGLYWHMIELIARHLDPPRETSCELQEDIDILAHDGNLETEKCKEIVEFMIEIGLFEKIGESVINTKVLRRLSDAQKKRIKRNDNTITDNRRTSDGHKTDTVRCEVEVNRIKREVEVNRTDTNGGDKSPLDTKANFNGSGLTEEQFEKRFKTTYQRIKAGKPALQDEEVF